MILDVFDIRGRLAVRRARRFYELQKMETLWAEIRRKSPVVTECPICVQMYDARKAHRGGP
jgi:hypothetical protein